MQQCQIYREDYDVNARLAQLGLRKEQLERIVLKAVIARNEAVPIDPNYAPGTLAYIYGTRAIREEYLPKGWQMDKTKNIESTFNPKHGIRLVYQNVDRACELDALPRALSGKGSASAQMVESGQQYLFEWMEEEDRRQGVLPAWFLCVAVDGDKVTAELSCPVGIEDSQFSGFGERIFILQPGDWDTFDLLHAGSDEDEQQDFDVKITKK